MAQPTANRRTMSHGGSSRLSLSVDKTPSAPSPQSGRHPLRQERVLWSISYVHRPPNAKVEYEKEIRRVATFGSIESFLHLYSHLTPVNELPAVTDVLVFVSRISRPGIWEEMREGGRFTIRLVYPIIPVLYESLLLALIGDQFDESDSVVGCVLSMRQQEGILSVWVEEESGSVRNGSLKQKILTFLNLPPTTTCDYRANRALLENANKPHTSAGNIVHSNLSHTNENGEVQSHGRYDRHRERGDHRGDRGEKGERRERGDRDSEKHERGERLERDGERWSNRERGERRAPPSAGLGTANGSNSWS
nr:hypothetical protein L203_04047 [Cryptococcus depauperatus CBS 7841]